MRRHLLQTSAGKAVAPNVTETQDYFVLGPSTDLYEIQQPLGSNIPLITPGPQPPGKTVLPPLFFEDVWASQKRVAQQHLSYKIGFLDEGELWLGPHEILVGKSQELQPIYNARWHSRGRHAALRAQEGFNTIRTSEIPSGQYADFKCRILNEVQRHFLEPVVDNGETWQLWTSLEVHEALELRVYRFLVETGLLREESPETSPNEASIPQNAIEVRRVEYRSGSSSRGLSRMDAHVADLGYPGWDDTTGSPVGYVEEPSVESMVLRVCPPAASGSVTMRYVPAPEFSHHVPCEPMPIPRMFTWAVKWGLISDLLKKEGEANDPVRAKAAETVYELGVRLGRLLLGTRL